MGSFKNQKDKVVGNAKEKIGEILNKENLIDEGRTQSETAEEKEKQYQARIDEIEDQQAEEVYYYPGAIECKAKWDVTESWNPKEKPLSRQKPGAITKQKPDKEKKVKNQNVERAKKLGIQYIPKI